MTLQLWYNK